MLDAQSQLGGGMRELASKKIHLGLQGAGAYGAYTWGVLDRLLDEENLVIDSLSGSSSGAINAAVLADGYSRGGGRRGAQQALSRFWNGMGQAAAMSPLQRTPLDYLAGGWTMEYSPTYHMLEMAGVLNGPVAELPFTRNPLRHLLSLLIDFDRVRACEELQLFVAATNVRTGGGRIFTRDELDVQKLLASACLPTVFAAVEVDGETYWDGSFVANPPLVPFLKRDAADVMIVQNNPIGRTQLPRSMADIGNRANEIAFNISFQRELNAWLHGQGLPDEKGGPEMRFEQPRLHLISGTDILSEYSISSKMNGEPGFLQHLHERGFAAASEWLERHAEDIGVRSTLDPSTVFCEA
jgi:NTE family protein